MSGARDTISVDPIRLNFGHWEDETDPDAKEGDIIASYSADRIGMDEPLRRPFKYRGELWVCTSLRPHATALQAEAYRLVHPGDFQGTPASYHQKSDNAATARADPNGFYHGVVVKSRGVEMILCGPPCRFVPGESQQLSLFAPVTHARTRE